MKAKDTTRRARALADSAQRWADTAETRLGIARIDRDLTPFADVAAACAVSAAYSLASIAREFTQEDR